MSRWFVGSSRSSRVGRDDREPLAPFERKRQAAEESAIPESMLQVTRRQHFPAGGSGLAGAHLQLPVVTRLLDPLILQLFQHPLPAVHAAEIAVAPEPLDDGLLAGDLLVLPPRHLFQLLALCGLLL